MRLNHAEYQVDHHKALPVGTTLILMRSASKIGLIAKVVSIKGNHRPAQFHEYADMYRHSIKRRVAGAGQNVKGYTEFRYRQADKLTYGDIVYSVVSCEYDEKLGLYLTELAPVSVRNYGLF